jgi:transposase
MPRMVLKIGPGVKSTLRRMRRETRDKGLAVRCQIILLTGKRKPARAIAEALGCSASWVHQVRRRFRTWNFAGLIDRREDNGQVKLDERFLAMLYKVVDQSPQDYGYLRPTWTRELLVEVLAARTGTRVHRATMSRALRQIGARRGRPRPMVRCPWSKAAKQRRLRRLRRLLSSLPPNEVAYYEDEVDIHLNPKIGLDWMNRGTQKEVLTPGQNEKCYLAGALDARSGRLIWAGGVQKNSLLFLQLLKELLRRNPSAPRIHLILDNFRIHDSQAVRRALADWGERICLHFLPPYCPNDNRIERVWKDLHDNVTRNHRCKTMSALVTQVLRWLCQRNHQHRRQFRHYALKNAA